MNIFKIIPLVVIFFLQNALANMSVLSVFEITGRIMYNSPMIFASTCSGILINHNQVLTADHCAASIEKAITSGNAFFSLDRSKNLEISESPVKIKAVLRNQNPLPVDCKYEIGRAGPDCIERDFAYLELDRSILSAPQVSYLNGALKSPVVAYAGAEGQLGKLPQLVIHACHVITVNEKTIETICSTPLKLGNSGGPLFSFDTSTNQLSLIGILSSINNGTNIFVRYWPGRSSEFAVKKSLFQWTKGIFN